jgi:Kef-type K+ transport system membrane component KefB
VPDRSSRSNGLPARRTLYHRRFMQTGRWWKWFVVLACFAFLHDFGLLDAAFQVFDSPQAVASDSEGGGGGHADPVAPVLAAIVLILLLAKIGGDVFERINMPAVLGELVVGILLGNCALMTGWHGLDFFKSPGENELAHSIELILKETDGKLSEGQLAELHHVRERFHELDLDVEKIEKEGLAALTIEERAELYKASQQTPFNTGAILKILAGIGVVLLLFEVGLESTVREMMSVGVSSLLVAILGVVVPICLGWGIGWVLIPEQSWQVHAFIGATLCATSVGITARVLKDLGCSQQREAKIILGAAVIDDVLGLVVLAIVSGVIQQGTVDPVSLMKIIGSAFGFLLGAILLGTFLFTKPLFTAASYLRGHGLLVASALVICFGFAWLANLMGLAPIVGAFAAGLILEKAHYKDLGERENHELDEALAPISALLVPIFFVQMGTQVDLSSFGDPAVWALAAGVTVMAIIGKQVCAFGVREKGLNTLAVGLGMIPRGEVGLIFADVGKGLKRANGEAVINDATFSAIIVMVMVTTMVTPPLLKWALTKDGGEDDADSDAPAE